MSLSCDLEADRDQELATVLSGLSEKLVKYTTEANSPQGNVGEALSPEEMIRALALDLPEAGQSVEGLFEDADKLLKYSTVTWNQGFLDKLYASTNAVGIASDMLLSVLNTNSHVYTVSPALTIIENKTGHEYAKLFGFTGAGSGGYTFPGGSYSNSTSLNVARNYLFPDTKEHGNGNHKFAVFASEHCHYSVEKAAIFLGLGSNNVFKVRVHGDGTMDVAALSEAVDRAKSQGFTPLYVNTTAGTTVFGSFDDFTGVAAVARRHGMWMHIDGSWGGNVVFSDRYRYKLKGCELADSITVNPHKMLGVPTTCSFLLVPDRKVMQSANSLKAPYLFHNSRDEDAELYDLADATMGCGRRPDALKLYLSWRWFGRAGFARRIEHAYAVTAHLAQLVHDHPDFELVSELPPPCLQTCFFYAPKGKLATVEANTQRTRAIVQQLHKDKKFLVDYAPDAQGRGEFFRVVVNSPIVSGDTVERLVMSISEAGTKIAQ